MRLELAMDIAGLGTFDLDLTTDEMTWSDRATDIYGLGADVIGDWPAWIARIHPDDRSSVLDLRRLIENDPTVKVVDGVFRFLREDGETRWIVKRGRVFRRDDGTAVRISGVVADETDRRTTERRSIWLTKEMQHRIKNMMSMIRSLSRRTIETSASLEDFAAHFDGRLGALARVQTLLSRRMEGGVELEELLREEFVQDVVDDSQVELVGGQERLGGKAAEYLALAIHELTVNAIKFGALATRSGRIVVCWTEEDDWFMLTWIERGVPLVSTKPSHEGFGRQLIEEGLPYQLGAQTEFSLEPGGLKCSIRIPLTATAGAVP